MPMHLADDRGRRRWRLYAAALGLPVVVSLAFLAPDLIGLIPQPIRKYEQPLSLIGLVAGYLLAIGFERFERSRGINRAGLRRALDRIDAIAAAGLGGGLAIAAAGLVLAFLATYIPHYLLWPWSCDADTFAVLARSWDEGIRPYRDIRGYNFPGAIYLHWAIGKVCGWGRTWPLYLVDSAGLIGLGAALSGWSRRCLGGIFPGLASYAFFLTFYMSHDFMTVAERDWHTALCMAIGLLAMQGWPGPRTRALSAMLAAAALTTRPHAVVFLPAMAMAVLDPGPESVGETARARARRLVGWVLMLSAFATIAFAPVVADGLVDDLVRGLRVVAYGGPYSQASLSTAREVLAEELTEPRIAIAIAMLIPVVLTTRGAPRRRAVTWAAAMVGAVLYRPFHPVQHFYLTYPLDLFGSIALAPTIAWILDRAAIAPAVRVIVAVGLLGELSLGLPTYCTPTGTLRALIAMARGQDIPATIPPGARNWFGVGRARYYAWDDYRATLLYLRQATSPKTQVANMLRQPPFPAVNGPTGRLSPFRAESGIWWMVLIDMDLEPEFVPALQATADSVVVWSPGEGEFHGRLRLERLCRFIRAHYRPEARFGRIEVWRRARDRGGPGCRRQGGNPGFKIPDPKLKNTFIFQFSYSCIDLVSGISNQAHRHPAGGSARPVALGVRRPFRERTAADPIG